MSGRVFMIIALAGALSVMGASALPEFNLPVSSISEQIVPLDSAFSVGKVYLLVTRYSDGGAPVDKKAIPVVKDGGRAVLLEPDDADFEVRPAQIYRRWDGFDEYGFPADEFLTGAGDVAVVDKSRWEAPNLNITLEDGDVLSCNLIVVDDEGTAYPVGYVRVVFRRVYDALVKDF
ncbi:MAG TPA: hypothetical protein ENG11_01270, partial [candidate division Zixibacteria bacterium]|nr:hypothetical protein [candidate division Zixibacteria bacterium]